MNPEKKQNTERLPWAGHFPGDYAGSIWSSFNIDLERYPDSVSLSDKFRRFSAGLGVVTKFVRTNATATDQWFGIVNGADILRNGNADILSGTWISDDTTGTFNDPLDAVIHETANGEERLLCSRASDIAILNKSGGANIWDDDWFTAVAGGSAPTSLDFHPLAKLQRLVAHGDKQNGIPVINTIDKDDVVSMSRLSFGTEYTVRAIYTNSNLFWIALQNNKEGRAKIIVWDGYSLTYNAEYELVGSYPLVGFMVRDVPYFITERGYIERFNGGGFEIVQNFGIDENRAYFGATTVADAGIVPYGVQVEGDIVFINVKMPTVFGFSATNVNRSTRRQRAGIWLFNTKTLNLYHHMGFGEHASAGTDVNYGNSPVAAVGAVVKTFNQNTLVASASVYIGGATWQASTQNGIYIGTKNSDQVSDAGRNRGYFVTPRIPIEDVQAAFESLLLKFRRFVNAGNRIVIKWRVVPPLSNASAQDQSGASFDTWGGIQAPATWVNTTSFSCKVPTGIQVGDEVEILTGDNAGCSFKISALSGTPDNSTTLTVTIAEAAPTSSTDTFLCRFDNWKTEDPNAISATDIGSKEVSFTGTAHGEFIQFKVELRGFDVQVDQIIPKSKAVVKP